MYLFRRNSSRSPNWPQTPYVDDNDPELPIVLPTSPECWELQGCATTSSVYGFGDCSSEPHGDGTYILPTELQPHQC